MNAVAQDAIDFATKAPRETQDRGSSIMVEPSRTLFNPFAIDPNNIYIEDIARGLANTCRYGGHMPHGINYNVAQHSVLVSKKFWARPDLALAGLLHDAEEYVFGDMPSPIKRAFPEYTEAGDVLRKAIFERFGIPYALYAEVKFADDLLYFEERESFWGSAKRSSSRIIAQSPVSAETSFLLEFRSLYRGADHVYFRKRIAA